MCHRIDLLQLHHLFLVTHRSFINDSLAFLAWQYLDINEEHVQPNVVGKSKGARRHECHPEAVTAR